MHQGSHNQSTVDHSAATLSGTLLKHFDCVDKLFKLPLPHN